MSIDQSGAALNHLTPRPVKGLFADNYLSITGNDFNFTKQFLPEVYEKEVERYGNRTVAGFLRMVGAEMPFASDRIVWSEQGRLHIAYKDVASNAAGDTLTITHASGEDTLIGPNQTLVVTDPSNDNTEKVFVVDEATGTGTTDVFNIKCYSTGGALPAAMRSQADLKVFVYGSEYGKSSTKSVNSIDASFTTFENKPLILRDIYTVSGSDTAQIGWVEVTTEAGTGGYLWYLKSQHESRLRFEDYLEMSMVEAELASSTWTDDQGKTIAGSEGLFAAIESRGLVFSGTDFATNGIGEFDDILKELDKQGAIEENMLFLDRATSLGIDNMLAEQNSYGANGTSYGVFDNSEDMALNLGFSGFRRGSYDFYKTDWKYLNDSVTRGNVGDILGCLVPAGVSTVYDQTLGKNIQRPFLHIRYRASEADDRRLKSWITGSVGGNYTSDIDEMNVHFLSERALCVQGANNFVLLKA